MSKPATDGTTVYATGPGDSAIAVFSRNASTGRLTFLEAKTATGTGLGDTLSVAVSPNGDWVFATGRDIDLLAVFSRNQATGRLTWRQTLRDGIAGVDGLDDAREVKLSPDGAYVYVAARLDNTVALFRVNGM